MKRDKISKYMLKPTFPLRCKPMNEYFTSIHLPINKNNFYICATNPKSITATKI